MDSRTSIPGPRNLVAELTYRCPLRCAYCSNPLDWASRREALAAADWCRVFSEASALGAVHVGLTGGEPTARTDLAEIVAGAASAQLFTHLVTAGTLLDREGLRELASRGLRSVQLSLQDSVAASGDEIAGVRAHERKLRFAEDVRALGIPLILNVVLHRRNLERVPELIALAEELGALRLELANVQLHGFALENRDALLPTREQLESAARAVAEARARLAEPELLFVLPDYYADRPKPCMGGWGSKIAVVAPDGAVLPCHAAQSIPSLEFWNVRERSFADCWRDAPGMNAYRGEAWMRDPCKSCPERARDYAGCRCQAFALTGDAAAADPACKLAPAHAEVLAARVRAVDDRNTVPIALRYRSTSAAGASGG
jgi:pyrroloquinoline quinone biosynthesis protein E